MVLFRLECQADLATIDSLRIQPGQGGMGAIVIAVVFEPGERLLEIARRPNRSEAT